MLFQQGNALGTLLGCGVGQQLMDLSEPPLDLLVVGKSLVVSSNCLIHGVVDLGATTEPVEDVRQSTAIQGFAGANPHVMADPSLHKFPDRRPQQLGLERLGILDAKGVLAKGVGQRIVGGSSYHEQQEALAKGGMQIYRAGAQR